MDQKTITEFLLGHAAADPVSFHMPGHKGSSLYRRLGYDEFLDHMVDIDITEIPGADNLFQTEGIIAETMERYRSLYGSRASYLLINGSSAGLISAIMAGAESRKSGAGSSGGTIVLARNCHKSIFNGAALTGLRPVYAYPEIIDGYGISGPVTPQEIERCLIEDPSASAVILPSPNYYGICSDIAAIAGVVHSFGKILIVDQAHGAHLKFFAKEGGPDLAAEDLGADIVINSTHKTLASFTQTAVANIMTERVDLQRFEEALGRIESTSPSYILMASLDVNADILEKHRAELICCWRREVERFYTAAAKIPGLRVLEHPLMDRTKIDLDMSGAGLDGHALEQALMDRGIFPELVTGSIVMCMTGIGNTREHFDRLLAALSDISGEAGTAAAPQEPVKAERAAWSFPRLEQREIPGEWIRLPLGDGAGRVCARALIPYPPGIPMVCPGEVLTDEICAYLAQLRAEGENVIGVSAEGTICVGK